MAKIKSANINSGNALSVADIARGDIFEVEGRLFIKIVDHCGVSKYIAIDLGTGEHVTFTPHVVPNLNVKCTLVIE